MLHVSFLNWFSDNIVLSYTTTPRLRCSCLAGFGVPHIFLFKKGVDKRLLVWYHNACEVIISPLNTFMCALALGIGHAVHSFFGRKHSVLHISRVLPFFLLFRRYRYIVLRIICCVTWLLAVIRVVTRCICRQIFALRRFILFFEYFIGFCFCFVLA